MWRDGELSVLSAGWPFRAWTSDVGHPSCSLPLEMHSNKTWFNCPISSRQPAGARVLSDGQRRSQHWLSGVQMPSSGALLGGRAVRARRISGTPIDSPACGPLWRSAGTRARTSDDGPSHSSGEPVSEGKGTGVVCCARRSTLQLELRRARGRQGRCQKSAAKSGREAHEGALRPAAVGRGLWGWAVRREEGTAEVGLARGEGAAGGSEAFSGCAAAACVVARPCLPHWRSWQAGYLCSRGRTCSISDRCVRYSAAEEEPGRAGG